MDLSKLSDNDLKAISDGRMDAVSSEGLQYLASQIEQPRKLSAGDVAAGAIRNFPESAFNLLTDLATAVSSPIQTAKSVLDLGAGVLQAVLPESLVQAVGEDKPSREVARKVGEFYADRYGSVEGAKRAIATDPAGVLADAATVLYGAGGALRAVPGAERAAAVTQRAGATIDPLSAVMRGAGTVVPQVLGMTTGAGREAISQAFEAGRTGGERARMFRENISGAVPQENVLNAAKQNLAVLRSVKSDQYRSGMVNIAKDKTNLSFDGIDKALSKAEKRTKFKGQVTDAAAFDKVTEAKTLIDNWKSLNPAEYHTPEGMDALKQSVGAILEGLDPKTNAYNTINDVYGSIKGEIVKQAPVYANVMSDYTKATDQIREIEKALSLGNKASADTTMRKLQSLMRDNVQTNYGQRVTLAKQLEEQGGQMMMPGIAGQSLQSFVPRGMSQVTGGGGAALLGYSGMVPQAAAMATMASPRLMGEAVYGAGLAARPLSRAGERAPFILTPELYNLLIQSGQVQQLQE